MTKKEMSVFELLTHYELNDTIKLNDLSRAILKGQGKKEPSRSKVDRLTNKLKKHIPKSAELRGDTFTLTDDEKTGLLSLLQSNKDNLGLLIEDLRQ